MDKEEAKKEEKLPENIPSTTPDGKELIHNMGSMSSSIFTRKLLIILAVVAVFGVGSGYVMAEKGGGESDTRLSVNDDSVDSSDLKKGAIVGSDDTDTFNDVAEGTLKGGGIKGEGAYHLERPGGESQNVYLTSSIVDLSQFINRKIKVWGETQRAQYAGWLMDVGRVEVLE